MQQTIFNTKVSYLENVRSFTAKRMLLSDLLLAPTFKDKVLAVREEKDPDKQKEMKAEMPCFTASGLFGSPVDSNHLEKHSGFICIDIDEKDNTEVYDFDRLKEYIHEIPYVQYCGRSIRGKGFFCLVPIKDPFKHKAYFKALQRDFKECGLTIDPACHDVTRRRFVSYDPNPYINTAAEVYDFTIPEYDKIVRRVADKTDLQVRQNVEELLHALAKHKTDITQEYHTWFEVLCAIASQFDEDGREYAHEISQYYEGYTPEETDNKYDDALAHQGYGYSIATLFYHANKVLNSVEYQFKGELVYEDEL